MLPRFKKEADGRVNVSKKELEKGEKKKQTSILSFAYLLVYLPFT